MESGDASLSKAHIFLVFAARLLLMLNFKMMVVFGPFVAKDWGIPLDLYPFSLIVAEVAGIVAGLAAPALRSVDPGQLLFVGQMGVLVSTASLAVASPPLSLLCAMRAVFGACRVIVSGAALSVIGQRVPQGARARIVGIVEMSYWAADLFLPVMGAALAKSQEMLPCILLVLAAADLVLAISIRIAFRSPGRRITADGADAYRKIDEVAEVPLSQTLRGMLAPRILVCILWPAIMQVGLMGIVTILGVWQHQAFQLDAAAVGMSGLVLAAGELGGCLLNLAITDKLGASRAVFAASWLMALGAIALCMQGTFDRSNLSVGLLAVFVITVGSEFGFVASMTWAMDASTEACGVPQLVLNLACRGASGVGRCAGTALALPMFVYGGIAANGFVASISCISALLCMAWSGSSSLS